MTGPFAAGKSTLVRKLSAQLRVPAVGEYPYGIDVAEPRWWESLQDFAEQHQTQVVETHLDWQGYDACDGWTSGIVPASVIKPPGWVTIHWVMPQLRILIKRQQSRDLRMTASSARESASADISWYQTLRKLMEGASAAQAHRR